MICLHQVSKYYPNGRQVLNAIDFHLPSGGFAFVSGKTGSGKSTLIRLLSMGDSPSHGEITIDGKCLQTLSKKEKVCLRQQISLLSSHAGLLPHYTVFDNVALPLRIADCPEKEIKKRVHNLLAHFHLLNKEMLYPEVLTTEERQWVALARAVISEPVLLLADEPTALLDAEASRRMMDLLAYFNQEYMTVLVVSHGVSLIDPHKHLVFELQEGSLREA